MPIAVAGVLIALVVLTATVGLGNARRSALAPDDRAEMTRAEATVDSLRTLAWRDEVAPAGQRPSLSDAGLITLAYVARADVGVGSPFRVAAFALRDTRIPASLGRAAAWAVLARASRGAIYSADTIALVTQRGSPSASAQRRAIASLIGKATNARTGELAVRLGYALSATEGTVGLSAANGAVRVAAQLRDRRLAAEDARQLLRASAADRDINALTLLPQWRTDRRFSVEQPLLGALLQPREAEAARLAIAFRDVLRELAQTPSDDTPFDGTLALLPPRAARRLSELPSVKGAPPQAPVAVATAAFRRQLTQASSDTTSPDTSNVSRAARAIRERFADRARSEESLVAELALASGAPGGVPADVAQVALAASVSMRAFAQDTLSPFAGSAPTIDALRARFGLRDVTFDKGVPAAWRPYYVAELNGALEDLQSVLPWLTLDGLAVRVGESVKRDSALALHDPATRTVYLPAGTSAGTFAHELAHDLDWQTARARLSVYGAYSTDRASRDGRGRLAVSVRGLAAARPRTARTAADTAAERPAELFARGVDWYVAAALAASGRSDGALSAVQDEAIAGYAGVTPPMPGDGAAESIVDALSDMTVLPVAARSSFLERYGAEAMRTPSAASIVRAAVRGPSRNGGDRVLRQLELVGASCVGTVSTGDVSDGNWRMMLMRAAAESRALGMLRGRSAWASPTRFSWEARSTTGWPWSAAVADSAVARLRDGLLRAVAADDAARHPFGGGVMAGLATTRCRS